MQEPAFRGHTKEEGSISLRICCLFDWKAPDSGHGPVTCEQVHGHWTGKES